MRSGDWSWIAVGGVVVGCEVVAVLKDWPLLSETMDGYLVAHPIVTYSGVVYVAAHLLNFVPARLDPLHRLSTLLRR